ncbi:MAG: ABC transporter ATP-binding protein [Lachnospiraceae bacterium]|nr:ABC transporter ATP-binding protein [Lachnospiraceae bacterium]
MSNVLEINNMKLCFHGPTEIVHAVRGVSLFIKEGEIVALVGESGSGKTALCRGILRLHASHARFEGGEVFLQGQSLITKSEKEMEEVRGKMASMVFQDPLSSLDPVRTVYQQVVDPILFHAKKKPSKGFLREKVIGLLEDMGMEQGEQFLNRYPHQLSGGQRQRVAFAIALALDPPLLIADEPTTALDPDSAMKIMELIQKIAGEKNKAILFITHDLRLVQGVADRIYVMKDGRVIEQGTGNEIFGHPKEDYTKDLVRFSKYGKKESHYHGSVFEEKEEESLIHISGLNKTFLGDHHSKKVVLKDFSLEVKKGEILGIVGQSGCGKSTLARIIMGIEKADGGQLSFHHPLKKQMVFQDSKSAFNERMTLFEIMEEPLILGSKLTREQRKEKVLAMLSSVHLSQDLLDRHPYDVSGGQRQRAAIARALITDPEFVILDEPLSSLDVPIQAQIVHLLKELHDERNLTMIIIAHDIPMVEHISDRVISMESIEQKA